MKPQQLASLLNISPVTLRRWAGKEYAEFLSPSAAGSSGAHRSFSEQDARILAWVAQMRAQNAPPPDIITTLKSAQANNWHNLPPLPGGMAGDEPVALMPVQVAEERLHALHERYESQLQVIVKERDELRIQLGAARRTNEVAQDEFKTLQQRLVELTAKESELRGLIEQYTFGGHRLNVATLIVAALLAGMLIALIIIVLAAILPR